MDFLIDSTTGDFDFTDSGLQLCTDGDEARQRIDLALNLNLGEFFTHANYGLPWIENPDEDIDDSVVYFLGSNLPNPSVYVQKQLDMYLESLPIVDEATSEVEYDRAARTFTYTVSIVTVEGEEIDFPPYLQQF